jgi:hypothetical protein
MIFGGLLAALFIESQPATAQEEAFEGELAFDVAA